MMSKITNTRKHLVSSRIQRKSAPVQTGCKKIPIIADGGKIPMVAIDKNSPIEHTPQIIEKQIQYRNLIRLAHLQRQKLEKFIPYDLKDPNQIKLWIYLFEKIRQTAINACKKQLIAAIQRSQPCFYYCDIYECIDFECPIYQFNTLAQLFDMDSFQFWDVVKKMIPDLSDYCKYPQQWDTVASIKWKVARKYERVQQKKKACLKQLEQYKKEFYEKTRAIAVINHTPAPYTEDEYQHYQRQYFGDLNEEMFSTIYCPKKILDFIQSCHDPKGFIAYLGMYPSLRYSALMLVPIETEEPEIKIEPIIDLESESEESQKMLMEPMEPMQASHPELVEIEPIEPMELVDPVVPPTEPVPPMEPVVPPTEPVVPPMEPVVPSKKSQVKEIEGKPKKKKKIAKK